MLCMFGVSDANSHNNLSVVHLPCICCVLKKPSNGTSTDR